MAIESAPVMSLPDELIEFQRSLRKFVDEDVIPYERSGTLPEDARAPVHAKARELGI